MHRRRLPAVAITVLAAACSGPATPSDATVADVVTTDAVVRVDARADDAVALVDAAADAVDAADAIVLPPFCAPPADPSGEALRRRSDGLLPTVLPDNRAVTPEGREVASGGFPVDARFHPTLGVVYVANTGYTDAKRAVQAFTVADGTVLQEVPNADQFNGLAVTPDGHTLWAANGSSQRITDYTIAADGTLTEHGRIALTGMPAGLLLSSDATKLWVGLFLGQQLAEIDLATRMVTRTVTLPQRAYNLVHVPSRNELWIAPLGGTALSVVDLATFTVAASVAMPGNPTGLAASSDGTRIYATASDAEEVVLIDAATRAIRTRVPVAGTSMLDPDGHPFAGSSPSGIALDEPRGRVYVVRAADNAIGVYDSTTLATLGAIPTGWYPTSVTLSPDGTRLVVTNGKGFGAGPITTYRQDDPSGKERMTGTVEFIDLATVDLAAGARRVDDNIRRPGQLGTFTCNGTFPVPTTPGGPTPIEHVVLIVRENKTYDTVLGDLGVADANGDPSLALYGEAVTPNLHTLARQFTNLDNFYDDGETSVQGHLWLTSGIVNDYVERTWLEDYRGRDGFGRDAVLPMGNNGSTIFTHLIHYNVPFVNFGEVTGSTSSYMGRAASVYVDTGFPGVFFNTSIPDERKARYVVQRMIDQGRFPRFTYLLLPNDHTAGTSPGTLTPASMIADNDYGTGIVIDAIAHSRFWASTAIFVLYDDTQIGGDHVDYHRSVLVVASPWAKRHHTSHGHASYPAVFRTIEHILGVPPMNRYDANATPLYDAFTTTPDYTPFVLEPRRTPDMLNPAHAEAPGRWSQQMDFSGPDRNPDLGALLWYAERHAPPPPGTHTQWSYERVRTALRTGHWPTAGGDPDDSREAVMMQREVDAFVRWSRAHPEVHLDREFAAGQLRGAIRR